MQRFRTTDGERDQPLILAVHVQSAPTHTTSWRNSSHPLLMTTSLIFVISTSSAAGGLPLGVVVTSGERLILS